MNTMARAKIFCEKGYLKGPFNLKALHTDLRRFLLDLTSITPDLSIFLMKQKQINNMIINLDITNESTS